MTYNYLVIAVLSHLTNQEQLLCHFSHLVLFPYSFISKPEHGLTRKFNGTMNSIVVLELFLSVSII